MAIHEVRACLTINKIQWNSDIIGHCLELLPRSRYSKPFEKALVFAVRALCWVSGLLYMLGMQIMDVNKSFSGSAADWEYTFVRNTYIEHLSDHCVQNNHDVSN